MLFDLDRVIEFLVVEVSGRLAQLHREDEVIVLLAIDDHVARALRVVDEGALDKGDLDRGLVHIILAQLGEVQVVWIGLLLVLAHAHAPAHGA